MDHNKKIHPAHKLCTDPILRSCMFNLVGMLLMAGMMAVAFPFLIMIEMQASPLDLASLQGVGGVTSIVVGLYFGVLIDRFSSSFPYRWILPIFGVVQSLGAMLLYLATTLFTIYISQVLLALSSPFMIMLQKNMMRTFSMAELVRVQPILMGSVSMLALVLPNVGASLSAIGLRLPFLIGGANAALMAAVSLLTTITTHDASRSPNKLGVSVDGSRGPSTSKQKIKLDSISKVFIAHMLLSTPLFMIGDVSTMSVRLFVFVGRLEMSQASLALMMSCTTVAGGIFSILLFRPLVKCFGPFHLRVIGSLMNIGGAILMANVSSIPNLIAALACDVVATNLYMPCAQVLVKACTPQTHFGRFAAYQSTIMQTSIVFAPILGSLVYSLDQRYPWYMFKAPLSFMAACVNLSMMMFAYRTGLYQQISRLKGRFD